VPHDFPLITTISSALGLSLILGFFANRLKLPALVGYILAGILIGPFTPGFVANSKIAAELAEIGIMLLMFGVGLHFSLDDLLKVRKIAVPGALLQIMAATLMGGLLALTWGWNLSAALIFGISLSVASTVVLLRAMEKNGLLQTINGQIAVGWLIVEDLIMVLVLVLLPAIANIFSGSASLMPAENLWISLLITTLKIALFIAVMLIAGKKLFPTMLWHIARTGSRELFTLCVVAAAVSIAYGASKLFGVSFALGAFFAGMMMRESEFSHRAAEESLPFREAFAVLFFVSVGMLLKPEIIINSPFKVLTVIGIIIIGKSIAAALLVHFFKYPLKTTLTVSASLAQIGEFSFILAGLGVGLGLLPEEGQSLIVAGALISIALNPLVFNGVSYLEQYIERHPKLKSKFIFFNDSLSQLENETHSRYLAKHIVLIGYGRVGSYIGEQLIKKNIAFVVAEQNREFVSALRKNNIKSISGDASNPVVLVQTHIKNAKMLVLAIPDTVKVREIIKIACKLNPKIKILVRCHDQEEIEFIKKETSCDAFLGEEELAKSMSKKIFDLI
jgi:CPA2 family monovalent cation:H+ antiporter-2